jgi:hypothetical protein
VTSSASGAIRIQRARFMTETRLGRDGRTLLRAVGLAGTRGGGVAAKGVEHRLYAFD